MFCVLVEFGGVGIGESDHVAGILNDGTLHAEANAKERNLPLASEADGVDLAFDAPFAKATRDQDSIEAAQEPFRPLLFHVSLWMRPMRICTP